MTAPLAQASDNIPKPAAKRQRPRRPRPEALVYDRAELAWVLGRSIRHIRRIEWMLPAPIKALGKRWARAAILEWLERGGPVRK
jgi:hypothetical protein